MEQIFSFTLASANILAEFAYQRYATPATIPYEKRKELVLQALSPQGILYQDIICLQEVDSNDDLYLTGIKPELEKNGYDHIIQQNKRQCCLIAYRAKLFTLEHSKVFQLTNQRGSGAKQCIVATLKPQQTGVPVIQVMSVHIPFPRSRNTQQEQLKTISTLQSHLISSKASLVAGDFNFPYSPSSYKKLRTIFNPHTWNNAEEEHGVLTVPTMYIDKQPKHVDYLFYTPRPKQGQLSCEHLVIKPTNKKDLIRMDATRNKITYFSDHASLIATLTFAKQWHK